VKKQTGHEWSLIMAWQQVTSGMATGQQKGHELCDLVANLWPGHSMEVATQTPALLSPLDQSMASKTDTSSDGFDKGLHLGHIAHLLLSDFG
jgi:hypothetical protein